MSTKLKQCHCGSDGPFLGVQHKEGFLSLTCPECSRSVKAFTSEGLAEGWNELPASTPSQGKTDTEEKPASPPAIEHVMEQAQVFASAWSLVGGPFDSGDQLEQAKQEKEELLKMIVSLSGVQTGDRLELSQAATDVLAERRRQIEAEGWTPDHDDAYVGCEMAAAAATYALCTHPTQLKVCGVIAWPWADSWWKPTTYRQNLIKSGALIISEIERLDRASLRIDQEAGQ